MSEMKVGMLIEVATRNLDSLTQTIEQLKKTGDSTDALEKELQELADALEALKKQGKGSGLEALGADAEKLKAKLAEAQQEANELKKISDAKITLGIDNDERIKAQIEEVTEAYRTLKDSGELTGKDLVRAGELHRQKVGELEKQLQKAKPSLEDVTRGISKMVASAGGLTAVAKEAISFERAMAGVKKVVDGTPEEMEALADTVKELAYELGIVPEAVADIAAQGGQLGVAFADLPEFTRLAGQMSVAFGMTAEESANAAAKIQNVFGVTLTEMRALGDAINVLGNNTAAKEGEIVAAMQRIGGTAKQFGLAAEQAAALADAFIALGKPPEVAATAINALLTKMQTAPAQSKGFQEALRGLGITAEELAQSIRDNPEQAIVDFLGKLEQLDQQSRAIALTELFGAEYADDISLVAGSLDTLRQAFGLVADKSQTAGAMQKEFEAAMSTTGAKIEQAKIAIGNMATTIGTQLLPVIAGIADAVGGAANALTSFAEQYPAITQFVAILGSAKVASIAFNSALSVIGVTAGGAAQSVIAAFTGKAAAIKQATTSLDGFMAALSGLKTAGIVAALGATIALYQALASNVDEVRNSFTASIATWADAEIAQTRLNLALSEGVDVQGEYVQRQHGILKQELAAIDQRIAGYEAQKKAAQERFFVDEKAIAAADEAIAAEKKRRESLQETASKTDELIAKTKAQAEADAQAARNKELAAKGWEKLSSRISEADKAMLQIPEHSQRVIDGLREIAQSGTESGETLALAFREAVRQVETAEALEAVKSELKELALAGIITEATFEQLSATISSRFTELPPLLTEGAAALQKLGLDAQQVQTGVSKSASEAIGHFKTAAKEFGDDAEKMRTIFQAALKSMNNPAEVQALIAALEEMGRQAGLTAEDIREIGRAAPQSASRAAQAFAQLGVDIEAANQGISASAKRAFDAFEQAVTSAKEEGVKSANAIRAAFDQVAGSLKTKEEFAAYNRVLRETGAINKLTAEQQARLKAGMEGGAAAAEKLRKQLAENTEQKKAHNEESEKENELLEKNTDKLKENTERIKENTEEYKKNKEAKGEATAAEEENAKAQEKTEGIAISLYNATNLNADAMARLNELTKEWAAGINSALHGGGDVSFWNRRANEIALYADQLRDAQTAIDALNASTSAGTVTMEQIGETAAQAQNTFFGLDNTTLANLNAAIDAARQKLRDMKQEAEDTRASLEAQLASLRGDDSVAQSLNEQKRLRELNIKLQEAEAKGQREIADEYRRAIELQKQVFDEERRQAQQRKAEEAKRKQEAEQRQNNSTGSTTSSANRSTSSGKGISAGEVADAWDERIAAAEKRGAENFARELYQQAKRQAR